MGGTGKGAETARFPGIIVDNYFVVYKLRWLVSVNTFTHTLRHEIVKKRLPVAVTIARSVTACVQHYAPCLDLLAKL